jgi:hypothetical protein
MDPCNRFEDEGALRLEAGEPPDAHELSCADCQAARQSYQRLAAALRNLSDPPPPVAWQAEVLRQVGPPPAPPSSGTRWRWAAAAAMAAAAGAVIWMCAPTGTERLAVSHTLLATAANRRADSAVVGDTMRIEATGGTGVRELRLYRSSVGGPEELVARCPGHAGCRAGGDRLELTVPLEVRGRYRAMVLDGPGAVPATGTLEGDAAAARVAGARVELGSAVEVD